MWYLLLFALVDFVSGTCVVSPELLEEDAFCEQQTGSYIQDSSPRACAEHCHTEGYTGFFVTSHSTNTNACQCATDENCDDRYSNFPGSNAYKINCIDAPLTPKPYTKVFNGQCSGYEVNLGVKTLDQCNTGQVS